LWASSLVGRRSYRNTNAVLNDVILLGRLVGLPLIATDGFEYCSGVIARLMGPACVYGQVIKTRRNDRITRVDRRLKIGTATRLKDALLESEDSETRVDPASAPAFKPCIALETPPILGLD
jgi:hypothetical protein